VGAATSIFRDIGVGNCLVASVVVTEDSQSRVRGYGPLPEGAEPPEQIVVQTAGEDPGAPGAAAPTRVPNIPAEQHLPAYGAPEHEPAAFVRPETLAEQPISSQPYPPQIPAPRTGGSQPPAGQPPAAQPPAAQPPAGYPDIDPSGGYPVVQPSGGYPGTEPSGGYPMVQPSGGYPGTDPTGGYPVVQPSSGYPGTEPSGGYPLVQPSGGYPAAEPSGGYPLVQPSDGYPLTEPTGGYPIVDPANAHPASGPTGGYPVIDPANAHPGIEPTSGMPTSGYPHSQAAFDGGPAYGSQPDPHGLAAPPVRRIEPSPPPQRKRLLLGVAAGLAAGLLIFGTTGWFVGRATATTDDAASSASGRLGVFERNQVAINQPDFAGTGLVTLAQGWLPYLSTCTRSGSPGGPELSAGEKVRVRCTLDGMSATFVEYNSTADRDKARDRRLSQAVDAQRLTPGAGPAIKRTTPSERTTGNYVEYAYRLTERGTTRTISGLWWDDAETPVAGYLRAYWKGGVGESWEPMRDLWSRYA
jgi:hypothetical protein